MTSDPHRSRQAAADAEAHEGLVDLLVAHVDRAYVTAGQPGVITAIRDLFRGMSATALTDLVLQLGLDTEPVREEEPEERRPG
jgi:hypothetical protein